MGKTSRNGIMSTKSKKVQVMTRKMKPGGKKRAKQLENNATLEKHAIKEMHVDDSELDGNLVPDNIDSDHSLNDDTSNEEFASVFKGEVHNHQVALERLQETDSEFYNFLAENDKKLLQFNVSDSEDDSANEQDTSEDVHVPAQLEVASDESDFEDEAQVDDKSEQRITLKMIKVWQQQLQESQKSNNTIVQVTKAFNAALCSLTPGMEANVTYHVKGAAVFNGVVQLCVLYLGPAVRNFLQLKKGQQAHKSKHFPKIKNAVKQYFTDLDALLSNVTSGNILNVLLKHLHYMTTILISFPNCSKLIIKKLITMWGCSQEETVRVVAFLCILRMVGLQREALLNYVLKAMYLTYVKNTKFVSVRAMANINFMRRSLVEIYALDPAAAYQHVFLYIRQLAINLRNAIVDNKKENVHVVYNWQFVNSCKLWGGLLGLTAGKPQLQALIYPFVQVCIGTLNLVPTAAYFPLRFHVVRVLMDLSRDSGVFIPILPFLMDVLTIFNFNKKHAKVSMKPLSFDTVLRMGKSEMSENGFKDAIIDTLYACLLEYLATHSHSIAFPDMALFVKLQIKVFLKCCSIASYRRKMQQLLEKIDANAAFIEAERMQLDCALNETKKIAGFEARIKTRGTPLNTFFDNWNKVRNIKRNKELTKNDELGEYNLPVISKKALAKEPQQETDAHGKVVLFPSDSEEERAEADDEGMKPTKRGKRGSKTKRSTCNFVPGAPAVDKDAGDVVEDIVDW